jgi:hypothetical protein
MCVDDVASNIWQALGGGGDDDGGPREVSCQLRGWSVTLSEQGRARRILLAKS